MDVNKEYIQLNPVESPVKNSEDLECGKGQCNVKVEEPNGFIKWIEFTQKMKPQTNAIGPGEVPNFYSY